MFLNSVTTSLGYRLQHHVTLGSTNDEALRIAKLGDQGAIWIVSDEQTQGRGRHGREWQSQKGNLFASLLLINPCDLMLGAQLGFLTSLALYDALREVLQRSPARLSLKWPNDVLLDGAKCAGILLEAHRLPDTHSLALIIGVGVNVHHAPMSTPYKATALCQHMGVDDTTAQKLFAALTESFARRFIAWHDARSGFAAIRREWIERAAGIGENITIRLPHSEKTGLFKGIDAYGRLELSIPSAGHSEYIDAGDLFFKDQPA